MLKANDQQYCEMYFELVVASSMSVPEVGVGCTVFFDLFGFRWCVRARAHVRACLCMRSVLCVCVCAKSGSSGHCLHYPGLCFTGNMQSRTRERTIIMTKVAIFACTQTLLPVCEQLRVNKLKHHV